MMGEQTSEYERAYAEAVAYAQARPEGHGPYNGWCRVAGLPLKAKDCSLCQAAVTGSSEAPHADV